MRSSYADIHYYYGPPTAKPRHHRFDKGSYVYLFENVLAKGVRIEIANNAGTPDQDAFDGCQYTSNVSESESTNRCLPDLDRSHVQYSYNHSTLVTLIVDAENLHRNSGTAVDSQEWHLPTFDPRNENKYMYKLHTVDVYFWTKEDALIFVNGVQRVLPQHQVAIEDESVEPASQIDDMSPVVQKLENVAITDAPYQQGQREIANHDHNIPRPATTSSNTTKPGRIQLCTNGI